MSTTANIYVGGVVFSVRNDGYPDEVVPFLRDIIKTAKEFVKNNPGYTLQEAIRIQLHLEADGEHSWIGRYEYIDPDYTYEITEDGKILGFDEV